MLRHMFMCTQASDVPIFMAIVDREFPEGGSSDFEQEGLKEKLKLAAEGMNLNVRGASCQLCS